MKHKPLSKIGKLLMKFDGYRICIVDDEESYFNSKMLTAAKKAGFENIDRYTIVNSRLHNKMLSDYYDLIILDIRGSTDEKVARDGLSLAASLSKRISSYIAITSAHQYHLLNETITVDYVIENRSLTNVDFIEVLHIMVADSLDKKVKWYKKILFRIGFSIIKKNIN
jgi:hypothetical protein